MLRGHFSHTSELLSSAGMRRFIENAKETFEYIVVDLPPLGPVVDAKAFAPLVDGFVLVTEWGRTPRAMVRSMLESEPYVANKIVGAVLNKVDLKKLAKYGSFGGVGKILRQILELLSRKVGRAQQGEGNGLISTVAQEQVSLLRLSAISDGSQSTAVDGRRCRSASIVGQFEI